MGAYSAGIFSDNEILDAKYIQEKPFGTSSGPLKVYIPALMNDIPLGKPKDTPEPIDASCYCNAGDCKPSVGKKITSRNYYVAEAPNFPYAHALLDYEADIKVQVRIRDNLSFKLVSEELDSSHD